MPANLLVVWLLGPALRLGILALVLSFVPVLDPLFHGASLLLGIVLRLMTTLAAWCAALPVAHIALPVRYTLWVLAVFAVLAALFWRTRQLRRFVPVGFVCTVAAVMLGGTMQRDVVRLAMVGTAGNGCVVAVQNNRAVVLYRGSAVNGRAVQQYLTQNGAPGTCRGDRPAHRTRRNAPAGRAAADHCRPAAGPDPSAAAGYRGS